MKTCCQMYIVYIFSIYSCSVADAQDAYRWHPLKNLLISQKLLFVPPPPRSFSLSSACHTIVQIVFYLALAHIALKSQHIQFNKIRSV